MIILAQTSRFWNNQIAIAFTDGAGSDDNILTVAIGTPLSGPTFATYMVGTVPNTGILNYATLAQDINGNLVAFAWWEDYTTDPITDQLLMWTFDGTSSWGSPVLFFDEVANPPIFSIDQADQFGHTGGAVQLPNGSWVFSTAFEIMPTVSEVCGGFVLVSPPLGPGPLTLAFPVTNTGTVGQPYSGQLIASVGTPPYTFSIIS